MPIAEIVLSVAAEAAFGYVFEQTGLAGRVLQLVGRDSATKAFARALGRACVYLEHEHPYQVASLFDGSFFEHEGAPILAQFLIRDGTPSPSELAARWADALGRQQPEARSILITEIEPLAADFLDRFGRELKVEPEFQDLNDSRTLEQLAVTISEIRNDLGAGRATPGTRQDYLQWLIDRNLYLDPRGVFQTQRQVQLKLEDVYVSLRAQRENTPTRADRSELQQEFRDLDERLAAAALSAEEAEEAEDQRDLLLARLEGDPEQQNALLESSSALDLAEVVNSHDRLVILGDPGSGKSTLLRHLALRHAQALRRGQLTIDDALGETRFPVLIRIADYAENGHWENHSLSDYLAEYCSLHECARSGLANLFATELAAGHCLILLDGLDEIVSADDRRGVVGRIEDFVRRHDNVPNRFIVTSRIAGYRSAPLDATFRHYAVRDMDDMQIRRFLERWCPAVEAAQTPDISANERNANAQREIDAILEAVEQSPGVRRLAANPLLLRTLALIHRTGAKLPQKRIELYKLAADVLARTWRPAQGVPESALVQDEYLTPMLSKLAYWLHEHKPTGIATETEVYNVLGQEWARLKQQSWDPDVPPPGLHEEVRRFLQAVREHTGLFVERAPNRYGFMHLTFEEYYAARYLVARSKTRATLIRNHLHDPRWEEPILLALGFVGLDYRDEAAELFETAILAQGEEAQELQLTPSPYELLLGRDFLFALRCLGDQIPASPRVLQHLLTRLVDEVLHLSGSAWFTSYHEAVRRRLGQLAGSSAATALAQLLQPALTSAEFLQSYLTVEALLALGLNSPAVEATLKRLLISREEGNRHSVLFLVARFEDILSEQVILHIVRELICQGPTDKEQLDLAYFPGQASRVRQAIVSLLSDPEGAIRQAAAEEIGEHSYRYHNAGELTPYLVRTYAVEPGSEPKLRLIRAQLRKSYSYQMIRLCAGVSLVQFELAP